MKDEKDWNAFLEGYKSIGKYNKDKLRWCLINCMLHFYLMNKNSKNQKYLYNLKSNIKLLLNKGA